MSIEKAKEFAERARNRASLRGDPTFALEWMGQALYEIAGALEDLSAKIDRLTETQARRS
jgi:hypothetical protein